MLNKKMNQLLICLIKLNYYISSPPNLSIWEDEKKKTIHLPSHPLISNQEDP